MNAGTMLTAYLHMISVNEERLKAMSTDHPRRRDVATDLRHARSNLEALTAIVDPAIKQAVEELTHG